MKVPTRHLALVGLLIMVPISAWAIAYRPMNGAKRGVANEIQTRTSSLIHYEELNAQYRELRSLTKTLQQ